jgi:hypothetical protein
VVGPHTYKRSRAGHTSGTEKEVAGSHTRSGAGHREQLEREMTGLQTRLIDFTSRSRIFHHCR